MEIRYRNTEISGVQSAYKNYATLGVCYASTAAQAAIED